MVVTGTTIPDAFSNLDLDTVDTDVMSVRRLMWLRFKRNRLALDRKRRILVFMYLAAIFAGFIGPYGLRETHAKFPASPPLLPRFVDEEGNFSFRPFVYAVESKVDPATFKRVQTPNTEVKHYVHFFAQRHTLHQSSASYKSDIHLFHVDEPAKMYSCSAPTSKDAISSRAYFSAPRFRSAVGLRRRHPDARSSAHW